MLETIYRFNPMITNVGIVALEKNQINHHIYSRPIAIFGIIIILIIIFTTHYNILWIFTIKGYKMPSKYYIFLLISYLLFFGRNTKKSKTKPIIFYIPCFPVFTIFYQIDVFVAFLIF